MSDKPNATTQPPWPNDYESCPKCHGSFSFSRPAFHSGWCCPFCGYHPPIGMQSYTVSEIESTTNAAPHGSPLTGQPGRVHLGHEGTKSHVVAAPCSYPNCECPISAPEHVAPSVCPRTADSGGTVSAVAPPDTDLLDMADSIEMIVAQFNIKGWDKGLLERAAAQIRKDARAPQSSERVTINAERVARIAGAYFGDPRHVQWCIGAINKALRESHLLVESASGEKT